MRLRIGTSRIGSTSRLGGSVSDLVRHSPGINSTEIARSHRSIGFEIERRKNAITLEVDGRKSKLTVTSN